MSPERLHFAWFFSKDSSAHLDIVCSILFKDSGPMYTFLSKCRIAKSGDLAAAVTKALGIMSVFVEERQKQFQKYANSLMVIQSLSESVSVGTDRGVE